MNFDDIRAYQDTEVQPVLQRLLDEKAFLDAMAALVVPRVRNLLPGVAQWLVGVGLKSKLRGISTVADLQEQVEPYLKKLIEQTSDGVSFSGVEQLKQAHPSLYMANHRDIVLDPALLNFALYHHGHVTPHLAIGDNLVSRPWVGDLMRLNKSFLVKRSIEGRREKLQALSQLSAYIHSVIAGGASAWIAQREGRAKDGDDRTDTAIIKMLTLFARAEKISFEQALEKLHIVPVAISYEYNPCDNLMARELYEKAEQGGYQKAADEDLISIRTGFMGHKGQIHVAFGEALDPNRQALGTAAQAAAEIDRQVHALYQIYPSNYFAFEKLAAEHPEVKLPPFAELFPEREEAKERARFELRLRNCPQPHQPYFLQMYARPVVNKPQYRS